MASNNRSVTRALSILKAFQSKDEWLSISEVSRRSALPFASTHRLLQALGETGAVERGQGSSYRLGFLIASVAQNVNIDDCLYRACRDGMGELTERLNVSTFLGRLQGNLVVFIGKVLSANAKRSSMSGTGQTAAYSLALGRVLLADLADQDLDEIIKGHAFVPITPNTVINKAKLAAELALIRKHGFAVEREETYAGIGCVAVPIHDHEGRVIASMAVSEEVENLTPERVAQLQAEMMNLMPAIRRNILPETLAAKRKAAELDDEILLDPALMADEMAADARSLNP